MLLFPAVTAGTVYAITRLPSDLIPQEDQGVAMLVFQLPQGSALPRAEAARKTITNLFTGLDEIQTLTVVAGFDIFDGALRTCRGRFVRKLLRSLLGHPTSLVRASSAYVLGLPDRARLSIFKGRTRDLPVSVQIVSTHARGGLKG